VREVYAALNVGASDVPLDGCEIGKHVLEIHCKPPCGRSGISGCKR
jgi:hypothetical protein